MDDTKQVLTPTQQAFFRALAFTRGLQIYLAGGTALALQIHHRTSIDFDCYTQRHFTVGTFRNSCVEHLSGWKWEVLRDVDDTFEINAEPDIHWSCFYYRYPLLESPVMIEGVAVASLKDIAAMKLVAISQRGRRRDFVDMYYLLKRFTLLEILRFTGEKYPEFDIYNGLRGLLYLKDADNDRDSGRARVFDHSVTWEKVRKEITSTVREFQKSGALE